MIFIVSLILTFGFALSAVFIGFGPNAYRLSDKGFMSRAIQNAELEAMHYGDLFLRAGVLDTDTSTLEISNDTTMRNPFTYNIIGLGTGKTAASVTITSVITVNKDSTGAETITASAYTYK